MTRDLARAIGLAGLVALAGVAGTVRSGIEGRAGQIIFEPVPEINESAVRAGPTVEVRSCTPGRAGTTITGHIDPSMVNPAIAVTGGSEGQSGVRVGMAFAVDAGPSGFGELGDFVVVVPGATADSILAVRSAAQGFGPPVRCPERGTG